MTDTATLRYMEVTQMQRANGEFYTMLLTSFDYKRQIRDCLQLRHSYSAYVGTPTHTRMVYQYQ